MFPSTVADKPLCRFDLTDKYHALAPGWQEGAHCIHG